MVFDFSVLTLGNNKFYDLMLVLLIEDFYLAITRNRMNCTIMQEKEGEKRKYKFTLVSV